MLLITIVILFLLFNKWQPLNNYENNFLFHLKSSFRARDIQKFVFLTSPHLSPLVIALEDDQRLILKFMMSSIV